MLSRRRRVQWRRRISPPWSEGKFPQRCRVLWEAISGLLINFFLNVSPYSVRAVIAARADTPPPPFLFYFSSSLLPLLFHSFLYAILLYRENQGTGEGGRFGDSL